MPAAAALFLVGCCSTSRTTANYSYQPLPAQGAAAPEQRTEVIAATGLVEKASQADIQLHKEEMVVSKKEVSNGGVLIRTVVSSENLSQPVELRREEYVIERIPVSEAKALEAAATSAETAFQGREIYIPLTREEPVATKRAVFSEKVSLGKRVETDRLTVSTPVRSEDVEIIKIAGKAPEDYWQEPAPAAPSVAGKDSLNLVREEMMVGKKVVDNGGVTLRKIVHTQNASQPVELKREEFTIDRTPATEPQVASADFSPKEIRLTLSREQPVVSTRTEPTEWVRVRKAIHTDTQTVTGTVRKENIEIVKLTPDQAAMGGTGASGQSGATVLSGGSAKEMTISGKAMCAKCQLHQSASCQNIIQVKDGDKTLNYYLVKNDVTKNFHANVCKESKQVTATGSVQELAGKLEFTASKLALAE